jgi:hypothetical protein
MGTKQRHVLGLTLIEVLVVVWLREDVEYKVYQQLMTSDGANSNMPPPNIDYVLSELDYR